MQIWFELIKRAFATFTQPRQEWLLHYTTALSIPLAYLSNFSAALKPDASAFIKSVLTNKQGSTVLGVHCIILATIL